LDLEEIQVRQGHWAVVDLIGKGGHIRTVPIPAWVKGALDRWTIANCSCVTSTAIFWRFLSRHPALGIGCPLHLGEKNWSDAAAAVTGWGHPDGL